MRSDGLILVAAALAVALGGCATMSVTQFTREFLQPVRVERAMRDGGQLLLVYEVGILHLDGPATRTRMAWGTVVIDQAKWVPLTEITDGPYPLIDSPLPTTYLSEGEGPPPAPGTESTRDVAIVEIPAEEQTLSPRQRAFFYRVAGEHALALLTVTKESWPARLFLLIRGQRGEVLLARIEPPLDTTLAPKGVMMRALLYPFAIAADIVTAPVQAVLFALSGSPASSDTRPSAGDSQVSTPGGAPAEPGRSTK